MCQLQKGFDFGRMVELNFIVEFTMFQSLIQNSPTTQEVLAKITKELINKYQLKQVRNCPDLPQDLYFLTQQLKLYSEVLTQLNPQGQVLKAYHNEFFRLLNFLASLATHQPPRSLPPPPAIPTAFCDGCSGLLKQKNIEELRQEMLNSVRAEVGIEVAAAKLKQWAEEEEYEVVVSTEEQLVRRMEGLQQNIFERQVHLLRCIDDFENMRNDLLLIKQRQFNNTFDNFDPTNYTLQLTNHFLTILKRIEDKISRLKRSINAVKDQSTQVNLMAGECTPLQQQMIQPQNNNKTVSDVELRKLNEAKVRLEENCKIYQQELKELQAKMDATQIENKLLKEELSNQRFRMEVRQRSVRAAEKKMKQQDIKNKRKSSRMMMMAQQASPAQLESRFIQTFARSTHSTDEQIMPVLKAAFKQTFEGLFNPRLSLNLPRQQILVPPSVLSAQQQKEKQSDRPPKINKRSLQMQMHINESSKQKTRFVERRKTPRPSGFRITSQLDYKVEPKQPLLPTYIKTTSSGSFYKKAALPTEGAVKGRNSRHGKLKSLLSQYQNAQQDQSNIIQHKQTRSIMKTDHSEQRLMLPEAHTKTVKRGKKTKINRNQSQLPNTQQEKYEETRKLQNVYSLKVKQLIPLDTQKVKHFLFLSDSDISASSPQPNHNKNLQLRKMEPFSQKLFSFDKSNISHSTGKKEKVILNLQEIGYLTNFYSLMAKIHMVDEPAYSKLKAWILSKDTSKCEEGKHGKVFKQIVSQIVFKHRECRQGSSLCPHLTSFLDEMEKSLKESQC